MIYVKEEQERINKLCKKLYDLLEGKKCIENAMHKNFYNRTVHDNLFKKLDKINAEIKETKKELLLEKKNREKSRKKI